MLIIQLSTVAHSFLYLSNPVASNEAPKPWSKEHIFCFERRAYLNVDWQILKLIVEQEQQFDLIWRNSGKSKSKPISVDGREMRSKAACTDQIGFELRDNRNF